MIFKRNGRFVALACILTFGFAFFSTSLFGENLASYPTIANSPKVQDLDTKDIILSANGAAGKNDWEYNAAYDQGWVQHTISWEPKGKVKKVMWRCVDNCKDDPKFDYSVKLDNGRMILNMKATNKERGLIRLQLTALVE